MWYVPYKRLGPGTHPKEKRNVLLKELYTSCLSIVKTFVVVEYICKEVKLAESKKDELTKDWLHASVPCQLAIGLLQPYVDPTPNQHKVYDIFQ